MLKRERDEAREEQSAGGPTWVQAAKNATNMIPIVMVGLGGADPVQAGLVESFPRPGVPFDVK